MSCADSLRLRAVTTISSSVPESLACSDSCARACCPGYSAAVTAAATGEITHFAVRLMVLPPPTIDGAECRRNRLCRDSMATTNPWSRSAPRDPVLRGGDAAVVVVSARLRSIACGGGGANGQPKYQARQDVAFTTFGPGRHERGPAGARAGGSECATTRRGVARSCARG